MSVESAWRFLADPCTDTKCLWTPTGRHIHAPDGSVYGEMGLTADASEASMNEFHGQDGWPCECGHTKRQHYFGDKPALDGSFGTWCQMMPRHCYHFTPASWPTA